MDSDCASCHVAEHDAMEAGATSIASMHSTTACVQCHADEETLAVAHEDATAEAVGNATAEAAGETLECTSCHPRSEIQVKTEEALKKPGGSANPHSNHQTIDLACTDCHSVHASASTLVCNKCHDFDLPEGWVEE